MVSTSASRPANYQEGPWFYHRNNKYYMVYASHCCPEGIGYAMSDSPTGPWEYKGMAWTPTTSTKPSLQKSCQAPKHREKTATNKE